MRIATFLLAGLAVAACDNSPTASLAEVSSGMSLSIQLPAASVKVGQRIVFQVTGRNTSERTLILPRGRCLPLMYRVYDADNNVVGPAPETWCFDNYARDRDLAPGEAVTYSHDWVPYRWYGRAGIADTLSAGDYHVVPTLVTIDTILKEGAPVLLRVER